jgi:hypothetical protein
MPDFGFPPPPPPPPAPSVPPVPINLNALRSAIKLVDNSLRLCSKDPRSTYTAKDVKDLLLDVRNVLDHLTSPSVLLGVAVELNDEAKAIKEAFNRDDPAT